MVLDNMENPWKTLNLKNQETKTNRVTTTCSNTDIPLTSNHGL
jgi:hypothetical protein